MHQQSTTSAQVGACPVREASKSWQRMRAGTQERALCAEAQSGEHALVWALDQV